VVVGIGTITNIVGKVKSDKIIEERGDQLDVTALKLIEKYDGYSYLDLFRNKLIADLSKAEWKSIGMKWSIDKDSDMRGQMVRDIVNRDSGYYKDQGVDDISGDEKKKFKKQLSDKYKMELGGLTDKEIEDKHQKVMTDHKVVMRDKIRKI